MAEYQRVIPAMKRVLRHGEAETVILMDDPVGGLYLKYPAVLLFAEAHSFPASGSNRIIAVLSLIKTRSTSITFAHAEQNELFCFLYC